MADPTNLQAIDDIKFLTAFNVEQVVSSETAIVSSIERYYNAGPSYDEVMGVVRIPVTDRQPIDAKFARIHWSGKGSDLSPEPDARQDKAIMDAIPWLTFSCVDCRFGKLPLGELKGELVPGANRLDLKGLEMRLAGSTLRGSAEWLARGSQMQTRARVNLETRNSELLLKRLGYTSPIGDAPGKLALDLNWRDVPYRLSLPTLAGSADYQLEGGTLREVNDKGARLLSLLSLDSLMRKLRLDFRDVFDKGFYFESMSASAAALTTSLPLISSSPILRRPTVG
jgi:uncharacterized protein YhdP